MHLLTGSGAALALMALIAATRGEWRLMFGWLGIALIVDGIDGPLARVVDTKKNAPNWDGVILDLVIDYLTYVFIPAYALIYSGPAALAAGARRRALHRHDRRRLLRRRADEGRGQLLRRLPGGLADAAAGVPGVLAAAWATLGIILVLGLGQFTWLKFIHPVRTARWRPVNLPICLLWVAAGRLVDLEPLRSARRRSSSGCCLTSVWLIGVGIVMQFLPARPAPGAGTTSNAGAPRSTRRAPVEPFRPGLKPGHQSDACLRSATAASIFRTVFQLRNVPAPPARAG